MQSLIKTYLTHNNYISKINEFEDVFLSHPNYPSLLAVTDGLTTANIENIAAKVPFKHFSELPITFIAELGSNDDKEFYFVEKNEIEVFITNNKNHSKALLLEDFEKIWTGVVLIVEENEEKSIIQGSSNLVLPLVLLILGILAVVTNNLNFISSLYVLLSLIGTFISYEIVKTYFKENNVAESKLCSANKEFSCNTTIKSKKYAFSKYVEFVDLPIVFFGFTTLGLIFSIVSINTIGLLSSLSLPIVAYSIYIQKKVLQKWCVLCLLISLTLIANSIFYWYFQLDFKSVNVNEILLLITMSVLWFFVKKLLITKEENKKTINQLLRFKRNEDVFKAISSDIMDSEEFLTLPKITFGNKNAPNTINLFLSPSCPHCHTAFKEALEVLEKHHEKIKIEIAYNLNISNNENPYLEIAKTIMQLFNQNKNYKLALIDWHINKLNLEEWKAKWVQNDNFIVENEQLEKQFQWCLKNEFNYAPVKIFNRKLMQQSYEIAELFYFFKEEN